jgi:hypothetical protein
LWRTIRSIKSIGTFGKGGKILTEKEVDNLYEEYSYELENPYFDGREPAGEEENGNVAVIHIDLYGDKYIVKANVITGDETWIKVDKFSKGGKMQQFAKGGIVPDHVEETVFSVFDRYYDKREGNVEKGGASTGIIFEFTVDDETEDWMSFVLDVENELRELKSKYPGLIFERDANILRLWNNEQTISDFSHEQLQALREMWGGPGNYSTSIEFITWVRDEDDEELFVNVSDEELKRWFDKNEVAAEKQIGDYDSETRIIIKGYGQDKPMKPISFNGTHYTFQYANGNYSPGLPEDLVHKEGKVVKNDSSLKSALDGMVDSIKEGYGWIDPDYVQDTFDRFADLADVEYTWNRETALQVMKYLIDNDLLYHVNYSSDDKGSKITSAEEAVEFAGFEPDEPKTSKTTAKSSTQKGFVSNIDKQWGETDNIKADIANLVHQAYKVGGEDLHWDIINAILDGIGTGNERIVEEFGTDSLEAMDDIKNRLERETNDHEALINQNF